MICGFDADSAATVCSYRQYPDNNAVVGILLFGYGTEPDTNAVFRDGIDTVTKNAAMTLQALLDEACCGSGASDLRFVAAKMKDALCEVNSHVRKVASFLGQGIYIGGVLSYLIENRYVIFPFGGGTVMTWDGNKLNLQGQPPADGLIRDALGCRENWAGQAWQGTLATKGHLLSFTEKPEVSDSVISTIRDCCASPGHPNTLSMLLRREIGTGKSHGVAVLDMAPS